MFAVIRIAGKQYTVSKGDIIDVDHVEAKEGDTIDLPDVLLADNDGKVTVGTPIIVGAKAKAKVVSQFKGEKIDVRRYKSKVRHRRHIGFRPHLTKLEIVSL